MRIYADHLSYNSGGVLEIDGVSAVDLAEKFGTPLYVMSEQRMRCNFRRLRDSFLHHYRNFRIYYAVKANNNLAVLSVIRQEEGCADCSCPEEIEMAKKAGFCPEQLMYTGNYNSDDQLAYGLKSGAVINLDDYSLLGRLLRIGIPETLSFRINPGTGRGAYSGLVFGGKDTKFGIESSTAVRAYRDASKAGVKSFGIHMMAGSCVLNEGYFPEITRRLIEIAGAISKKTGIVFKFINIGGGFGVPYKPSERELDVERVGREVAEVFTAGCDEYGLGRPDLYIEPGRYIVCDAGILLARVTAIKHSRKTYIGTDAGMNTLLRPALYGAYHEIILANRAGAKRKKKVNVCGQVCENTDILARGRLLPSDCRPGDIFAVLNAGAYGYAMSSNYNSRGRPAEILIGCTPAESCSGIRPDSHSGIRSSNNAGKYSGRPVDVIRQRETVADMMSKSSVPQRLRILHLSQKK